MNKVVIRFYMIVQLHKQCSMSFNYIILLKKNPLAYICQKIKNAIKSLDMPKLW